MKGLILLPFEKNKGSDSSREEDFERIEIAGTMFFCPTT
jgi:hypothetical protein